MRKIFYFLSFALIFALNFYPAGFISKAQEDYYCDTSYNGSSVGETTSIVTIDFDNYTQQAEILDRLCPNYVNVTQLNSCAPMAASIVVGYYDVDYPNLIPNFEAGVYYSGGFKYKNQNSVVIAMKEELYNLMGTNSVNPGTSVSQFKSGFTKYVNKQGYNISYSSCGSTFNISTAKTYFEQQKPVVLFLNSYTYYSAEGIAFSEGNVSMVERKNTNGHVAVAYGYREYTFYKGGNATTNKYLLISYGDGSQGLLLINNLSCIDQAFAISIA